MMWRPFYLIVIQCAGSTTINLCKWQSKPCYEKSYHWKQIPGVQSTTDIQSYKSLTKPQYHNENIGIQHPEDCLRAKVHIKRNFQFPDGSRELDHIAKRSFLHTLKTLHDKPHMAAEVTYKLRADVNNGVLVKLTEFLKLPEVIEAGITQGCPKVHHTCSITHGSQCQLKIITS